MCTEREKGGRGVACIPLKTMAMPVAFLTKLVRGTEGHMASLFARFWIGFALRAVIPLKGTSPWSIDRPWHYQKVTEFIRGHPWCLVDGLVLDHRKLYKRWRDCWAAQSGQTHPQMPGVEWAAMQPTWLDGASKDLHWLGALRRLPGSSSTGTASAPRPCVRSDAGARRRSSTPCGLVPSRHDSGGGSRSGGQPKRARA
ncbi:hypothetical protein QTP70_004108 [Hemibagrus guttatus]|uniref:Uncharacterized protein n=1 Tax=Hemibagrus guttatus TaxID=175788 RepID=A0AAE0UHJ8_9TELE|nr:hypothetical protein QTP70_004108 [Hemibagrus guttatus]